MRVTESLPASVLLLTDCQSHHGRSGAGSPHLRPTRLFRRHFSLRRPLRFPDVAGFPPPASSAVRMPTASPCAGGTAEILTRCSRTLTRPGPRAPDPVLSPVPTATPVALHLHTADPDSCHWPPLPRTSLRPACQPEECTPQPRPLSRSWAWSSLSSLLVHKLERGHGASEVTEERGSPLRIGRWPFK